jgi:hypothetical protein
LSKKPPPAVWQYRDDSVFTTWEISFRTIETANPEAAKLLLICSFLGNLDISKDFLLHGLGAVSGKVFNDLWAIR